MGQLTLDVKLCCFCEKKGKPKLSTEKNKRCRFSATSGVHRFAHQHFCRLLLQTQAWRKEQTLDVTTGVTRSTTTSTVLHPRLLLADWPKKWIRPPFFSPGQGGSGIWSMGLAHRRLMESIRVLTFFSSAFVAYFAKWTAKRSCSDTKKWCQHVVLNASSAVDEVFLRTTLNKHKNSEVNLAVLYDLFPKRLSSSSIFVLMWEGVEDLCKFSKGEKRMGFNGHHE